MDYLPIQHTKVNSKWIKDLNGNPKTIKYKGKKTQAICMLFDMGLSNIYIFFWLCFLKTDQSFRINEIEKRVQNCHPAYLTYM